MPKMSGHGCLIREMTNELNSPGDFICLWCPIGRSQPKVATAV